MILVIVESPTKCKKIEEYLGNGYKVVATFGHLTELKSLKNIQIENNYNIKYEINEKRKKNIENLDKQIKKYKNVILATDDDREGEAIAYYVCCLFDLPIHTTKRIVFHEITEKAIHKALQNPTVINIQKVFSQQTRQILDLLVGFNVSPNLWKYISSNFQNPLSAGRCQSVVLRIVYDNHNEIKENNGFEYYKTTGYFTKMNIPFVLNFDYNKKEDVENFLRGSINNNYFYARDKPNIVKKLPPKPFITSSLQQSVSNDFHFSPKETMKICQELYEAGLITYMRTDNPKYSIDFIEKTKKFIIQNFNDEKYINPNIDDITLNENNKNKLYNKKNKNIQEAHEAIRPTNIYINEKTFNDNIVSPKAKKLYLYIWKKSIQSCMSPALYTSIYCTVSAFDNKLFEYTCEKIYFYGWMTLNNKKEEDKYYDFLTSIQNNNQLECKKIVSEEDIKNLKNHYSEAGLIKIMEQKGIGRPSTFAMLIDKIQERNYVTKNNVEGFEKDCGIFLLQENNITFSLFKKNFGNEKNKLIIQPLGIIVIEFLIQHYNDLFNYDYTKKMEDFLDEVENGNIEKKEVCDNCYSLLIECNNKLKKNNFKKYNIKIDENNTFLIGKNGPVIKSNDGNGNIIFKNIKDNIDIKNLSNYEIDELVNEEKQQLTKRILGMYQEKEIIVKKGRFGLYFEWGDTKKSLNTNNLIENITLEEVIKMIETNDKTILRTINNNISIRKSKKGNYIFFKTSNMKKPLFFKLNDFKDDYLNCDIDEIKKWIKQKYNIY